MSPSDVTNGEVSDTALPLSHRSILKNNESDSGPLLSFRSSSNTHRAQMKPPIMERRPTALKANIDYLGVITERR